MGMARSLLFPRRSDNKSFYCAGNKQPDPAYNIPNILPKSYSFFESEFIVRPPLLAELVAAVLKAGGLLSPDSNPGSATPHSLYRLYSKQAAATANPYTLRQPAQLSLNSIVGQKVPQNALAQKVPLLCSSSAQPDHTGGHGGSQRRRSDSPPRASFRVISSTHPPVAFKTLNLSLASLRG